LFAQRDEFTASAAGKEPEVANADEATGQDMKQETAEKLIGAKRREAFLVAVSGVSEAECDLFSVEEDQPVIRNGNAMGISTQVTERLIGPAERWLAVDHPTVPEELAKQVPEKAGLRQSLELPVEPELARGE
jgi:hypothetical protein